VGPHRVEDVLFGVLIDDVQTPFIAFEAVTDERDSGGELFVLGLVDEREVVVGVRVLVTVERFDRAAEFRVRLECFESSLDGFGVARRGLR